MIRNALASWYAERSTSERILLVLTALAAVFAGWWSFAGSHAAVKLEAQRTAIAATRRQLEELERSIARAGTPQGREAIAAELASAREAIAERRRALSLRAHQAMSPEALRRWLELVLDERGQRITLLGIHTEEAEPVGAADKAAVRVWRHPVTVRFAASWRDALDYLRALEATPWAVRWDGITVQAERWPKARFTLTVSTLSVDEAFIAAPRGEGAVP